MGITKKEAPPLEEAHKYKQCTRSECPCFDHYILKKNWARHVQAYDIHKDDRKAEFTGPRYTCDVCGTSIAADTLKRHNGSKKHLANVAKRDGTIQGTSASKEGQGSTRSESDSSHDSDTDAPISSRRKRTSEEEETQDLFTQLSVTDQGPSKTLVTSTPQQDVYKTCVAALNRTKEALAYAITQPMPCNPDFSKTRPSRKRKRDSGSPEVLPSLDESRAAVELPEYLFVAETAEPLMPLSAREFHEIHDNEEMLQRAWVVCTSAEARDMLKTSPLKVPVLIPAAYGQTNGVDDLNQIEPFLDYLLTKPTIELHRYDISTATENYNWGITSDATEAVAEFRDPKASMLNFLNLGNIKDNPVPLAVAGLRSHKILKEITEDNKLGKSTRTDHGDLSSCVAFHILANQGSYSLPHVDHHGVLTTITCDDGEKLWLTWPRIASKFMIDWDTERETWTSPPGQPFPIYLGPGDVLLQPRDRVHAPYSITNVKMSGTMHWDSRDMVGVLSNSLLQRDHESITNEGIAKQFTAKVIQIGKLWKERSPSYPWGTEEEYQEWVELEKKWHDGERSKKGKSKR